MKKSLLLTALLCIGLISGMFSQSIIPGYVDGEIWIKYKYSSIKIKKNENPENINMADMPGIEALAGKYGITKVTKPFYMGNEDKNLRYIYKVWFTKKLDVEALIRDLTAVGQIEFAEKVPLLTADLTPNDPQYGSQWHLPKIGAPNAWNVFNGNSPITVAIVDNAVDINHVDLAGNIWTNPGEIPSNGIDDDQNGAIDDVNGWDIADKDNDPTPPNGTFSHGTHCAGIAAARTNNSTGVAGIGFNLKIMAVKATPSASNAASIYNGYEGIVYAAKSKARVISCSWGGTTTSTGAQLVIDYAWSKGCIICVSAGNDANQVLHYPAANNHVYAVASSDNIDNKSSFSCFGTWVDITAPGSSILSTYPFNTYNTISGTSMACPLTAGLAGLILAKNPGLANQDVLNIISNTAANIYTIAANSSYVTGSKLGAGRINADGALVAAANSLTWAPKANFATLTPTVCAGVNVQFIDKTVWNPTAWNWTFASGTPATSTASAPVVTWATPGVYGVTLTASNSNGSNTAVKAGYITITSPISLPLQEGFQTGTQFPPVNWTNYDVGLDSAMWERFTGAGGFGTSTVCARFNNWDYMTFPDRDALRTPKYNMTAVTSAKLRFDYAYAIIDPVAYAAYYDSMQVMVSTNCGASWTSIYLKGGPSFTTAPNYSTAIFVPIANQWKRDSITLTGAAQGIGQGNVMFQFVNRGHYGQPIYLDNINLVYSATAPPTAAWSAATITCSGQAIQLTDLSAGTPTAWVWQMPGGAPATSTVQNPTVTYPTAGVYNVTLTASNGFGSTQSSKQITVTTTPTISIATTKGACFGNCDGWVTATVVPGTPPYSYVVSGGSCPSSPTCSNLCASNYTYNVTDSKGCTSKVPFVINSPTAGITSNTGGSNASCSSCANGTVTSAATGGYPAYTYSWSNGATTANINNVLPGCYTLTITDSQGCTDVSVQCIGFAGGIMSLGSNSSNVLIVPNPNNGQFTITADVLEDFDVTIYNNIGQLIKTIPQNKKQSKVDLSTYGKGIYNVVLSANGSYKTLKVVIE